MFNPVFSICKSVKKPEVVAFKTLDEIAEHIRTNEDTAKAIDGLRDLRHADEKTYKDKKNRLLYNILPSGTFDYRNNDSLLIHSHIISLDFDDRDMDVDSVRQSLSEISECCLAFVSPSGEGVKAFFRIKTETNQSNHRDAWQSLAEMVQKKTQMFAGEADPQAKALSQGCLVSHDPDVYLNQESEAFDWEQWMIDNPKPKPKVKDYSKMLSVSGDEYTKIVQSAVDSIDVASLDRGEWLALGMGLHDWNEVMGKAMWIQASSRDVARFDERAIERDWNSFRAGGGRTLGSVFFHAMENGWNFPAESQKRAWAVDSFSNAVDSAIDEKSDSDKRDAVVSQYASLPPGALMDAEPKLTEYLARAGTPDVPIKRSHFKTAVKDVKSKKAMAAQVDDIERADTKTRIFLNYAGGDKSLNDLVAEVEECLPDQLANPDAESVYNKDDVLVRIQNNAVTMQSTTLMRYWLTGFISFFERRKKGLDVIEVSVRKAPTTIEETMIGKPSYHFPNLKSLVHYPVILPSGKCLSDAGYNKESEIYLTEDFDIDYEGIKTDDASVEKAKSLLFDDLLVDFDWTDESRANYVAYLLTYPMRPFIGRGRVPMYVVDAPTRGVGKSKLIDIASLIWTGGDMVKKALPTGMGKEEEMRKLLHTIAIEGHQALLFDNIKGELGSPNLSLAITSGSIGGRILGVTKTVNASFDTITAATGNNVVVTDDMDRRFYSSRIETYHEKPELRDDFKHADIEGWTLENRTPLMTSLLTLIKNWQAKGAPMSSIKWGSFEIWTQVIGGILESSDIHGFLQNRDSSDTDEQIAWRAFVEVWFEAHKNNAVGVKGLYDIACSSDDDDDDDDPGVLDPYIYAKDPRGKKVALGKLIKSRVGRIFGKHQIVARDKERGSAQYALESIDANDDGGGGGEHGSDEVDERKERKNAPHQPSHHPTNLLDTRSGCESDEVDERNTPFTREEKTFFHNDTILSGIHSEKKENVSGHDNGVIPLINPINPIKTAHEVGGHAGPAGDERIDGVAKPTPFLSSTPSTPSTADEVVPVDEMETAESSGLFSMNDLFEAFGAEEFTATRIANETELGAFVVMPFLKKNVGKIVGGFGICRHGTGGWKLVQK